MIAEAVKSEAACGAGRMRTIVTAFAARQRLVLALKGNQSALHDDVKTFVDEQKTKNFADTTVSRSETVDGDHGRIETLNFIIIHDVEWLLNRHKWPGLKGIVIVECHRESGDKVETETRLFITSSAMDAEQLAPFVRGH